MKNNNIKLILLGIVIIIILGLIKYIDSSTWHISKISSDCKNKEYEINITLQSGEEGVLHITDNRCELLPVKGEPELFFEISDDGALENNVYSSKFYIWTRDRNLSIEEQIQSVLIDKSKGENSCLVEKYEYSQRNKSFIYGIYVNKDISLQNFPDDYCHIFGDMTDFSSEFFMETNNLLIAQREEWPEGIQPFDLASIRFVED